MWQLRSSKGVRLGVSFHQQKVAQKNGITFISWLLKAYIVKMSISTKKQIEIENCLKLNQKKAPILLSQETICLQKLEV